MKREMWIQPGQIQRFSVWTGLGSFKQHKLSSTVLDGQEFITRELAQAYLELVLQDIKVGNRPQLQGTQDVEPFSRKARTPGEEAEAKAWQRLQQIENSTVVE